MASAQHYDAIILDIMLPRQDGLWVCRKLRALSDVPILMVTARIEQADANEQARRKRRGRRKWTTS